MWDFLKNITCNVIASVIIYILGIVAAVILSVLKPVMIPYIIVVLLFFIVAYVVIRFGNLHILRFKWGHIYSFEQHILSLDNNCEGIDTISFKTKVCKGFLGDITGDYEWEDISVQKVELQANNSNIFLECKSKDEKEKNYKSSNSITIEDKPISAKYNINFRDDKPEEVKVNVYFQYKSDVMKPEYFVDVFRPMRKLVIELHVRNDIKIQRVKKKITSEYGDYKEIKSKELKSKTLPGYKNYRYTIYYPRLFHRYWIVWEWDEENA